MSTTDSAPSPGEVIAAALRKDPVYVDPSLAGALPPAKHAELRAAIARSTTPVYVLLVPLVNGSQWSDSQELATVVQGRFGKDGAYLTLDEKFSDGLRAYTWTGGTMDPFGNDGYAAMAVYFQQDMDGKPIADRLIRAVDLIAEGDGIQVYRRLTATLKPVASATPGSRAGHGTGWLLPAGGAVAAVALVGGGLLAWRQRRITAVRLAEAEAARPLRQRRVFATAHQAGEDELRSHAAQEVVALGELLESATVPTEDERVRSLMTAALDAYQAAGKVLDEATGITDLAGVLVLADQGRDALAAAEAVHAERPEPAASPLCFFNPLHGAAAQKISWRPVGSRRKLLISACTTCVTAVAARETPETLMDGAVPYFDADPEQSVWAETGFGQFRSDLVQRILRGDLHNTE